MLAAVVGAWHARPPGEPLSRLPARLARRTPLVGVVVPALGLAALVIIGPTRLAGDAYQGAAELRFPADQLWGALGWTTSVLTIATGLIAVPIGGAWVLRQVVRPSDVRAAAFAVIALTVFVLHVYVIGNAGAQQQERYPAPLAALAIVALGAALYRRDAARLAVVAGSTAVVGLLAARAVAARGLRDSADPLELLLQPGRSSSSPSPSSSG